MFLEDQNSDQSLTESNTGSDTHIFILKKKKKLFLLYLTSRSGCVEKPANL